MNSNLQRAIEQFGAAIRRMAKPSASSVPADVCVLYENRATGKIHACSAQVGDRRIEQPAHATSHKHGGLDEVATATAAANAIPTAGAGGTLATGWIPAVRTNNGSVTRAAATASGTETVAHGLGVAPTMIWFLASDDAATGISSDGWAQAAALSVFRGNSNVGSRSGFTTCIDVLNVTDGHKANISAVDATNFTINWTKVGNGRAVTVKWAAQG